MHTLYWAKGADPGLASIYCVHCRQVFRWRIEAQWARELVGRYNAQNMTALRLRGRDE